MSDWTFIGVLTGAYVLLFVGIGIVRLGLLKAVLQRLSMTLIQSFAWISGVVMGALAADPRPASAGLVMALFIMETYFWADPFLNDRYDLGIDRMSNTKRPSVQGKISEREMLTLYALMVPFPLVMAYRMSPYAFITMIAIVSSSLAYNVPPIRLKRLLPTSQFLPGFWAAGAVVLGYTGQTDVINPWFYRSVGAAFFTVLLTAGYKDLKDEAADRAHGIRNIVTTLGYQRAGKVMAIGTPIVFVVLPFVFGVPLFALVTGLLGLTGAWVLWTFTPEKRTKLLPRMATLLGLLALSLAYVMATVDRS